jgi:hypothetical protein
MKQETLEEVANEYAKNRYSPEQGFPEEDYYISFLSFRGGAKWQQEQILDFLYKEITERRDYSASKMCEVVIDYIKQNK